LVRRPEGIRGGDVTAVSLHTGFGGGLSGDNWNVNQIQLEATLRELAIPPILSVVLH
jgi:hypothetical protein